MWSKAWRHQWTLQEFTFWAGVRGPAQEERFGVEIAFYLYKPRSFLLQFAPLDLAVTPRLLWMSLTAQAEHNPRHHTAVCLLPGFCCKKQTGDAAGTLCPATLEPQWLHLSPHHGTPTFDSPSENSFLHFYTTEHLLSAMQFFFFFFF